MPGVHRVASLLKRWLPGTHQGSVGPEHLDAYLNEFTFRFNRRGSRHRGLLFYRLLEQAILTDPITYRSLIVNPQPGPQAANAAESLPAVAGDQAAVANPNLTESKIALRRAEVGRKMPAQVPSLWASRAVRPAARRGHRASVSVPIFMRSGRARQGA